MSICAHGRQQEPQLVRRGAGASGLVTAKTAREAGHEAGWHRTKMVGLVGLVGLVVAWLVG